MKIPYQNMEIEQIYTQLLSNPCASIAICAAQQGEGVTSLAFALAERNLLAGHSTLVVDLNLFRPALNSLFAVNNCNRNDATDIAVNPAIHAFGNTQLVSQPHSEIVLNGILAPNKREHIIQLRQPGVLEECIQEWLTQFDTVIVDTSPLNRINAQNIPPERVAAACDGALMVVLAGQTSEPEIQHALAKLSKANAQLLGTVLNDRDNPTLKKELLRETRRLPKCLSWFKQRLNKAIINNHLLSLEV